MVGDYDSYGGYHFGGYACSLRLFWEQAWVVMAYVEGSGSFVCLADEMKAWFVFVRCESIWDMVTRWGWIRYFGCSKDTITMSVTNAKTNYGGIKGVLSGGRVLMCWISTMEWGGRRH